ncbi:MAG: hypothetical protein LBL83_04835 [Clostridiales bacterium]|nr:hypothetical protein [Clostridiales bacterium]
MKFATARTRSFAMAFSVALIAGAIFSGCLRGSAYHGTEIVFPASDYQRTQHNAAVFDVEPFVLRTDIPAGWELKTPEAEGEVQSDLWSPVGIYKDHALVGSIGYNAFVYYPEAGDNPVAVYNELMRGSVVNWNNDYAPVKKSAALNTATCRIARTRMEPGMSAAEAPVAYSHGILAHDNELLVYIGMEIDEGALTSEELETLVGSISMER